MDRLRSSPPIQDFIFFSCIVWKPECQYHIFAVNLERSTSTGVGVLRPKVIVKCSRTEWKLCVVGYTLYLLSKDGKAATVDLSLFLSQDEPVELDEEAILFIAPMNHRKFRLEAIPTPGGKVLAFSTYIEFGGSNLVSTIFEVYDPATGCWAEIAPIHHHLPQIPGFMGGSLLISSYAFKDDSTLVIEEASVGHHFVLFLGDPVRHSRWQWHDPLWLGERFPFVGFSRGYELCLSGNLVWDIKNAGRVNKAVARFPPFETESGMIISGGRASCCYAIEITKKKKKKKRYQHYLRIEEYHLHLVEYFEEKKGREDKYFEDLKKVDGGWEREKLENMMVVTSPRLGWCHLRSSTFLLPPGTSPTLELDKVTTFGQ